MPLDYYHHPLASFCWKVTIALHENGVPFTAHVVDLSDPAQAAHLKSLWPIGKFPVLREADGRVVAESSIIIEHLDHAHPGPQPLIPRDAEAALEARLWDRYFDTYVHAPMQKIVADSFRAQGRHDEDGVMEARAMLRLAWQMLDRHFDGRTWAAAGAFSIADCAALPALFYAGVLEPFDTVAAHLAAYFDRLCGRASIVRTIREAQPYFPNFPMCRDLDRRFLDAGRSSFARG
jgi:glutathione S-transferase